MRIGRKQNTILVLSFPELQYSGQVYAFFPPKWKSSSHILSGISFPLKCWMFSGTWGGHFLQISASWFPSFWFVLWHGGWTMVSLEKSCWRLTAGSSHIVNVPLWSLQIVILTQILSFCCKPSIPTDARPGWTVPHHEPCGSCICPEGDIYLSMLMVTGQALGRPATCLASNQSFTPICSCCWHFFRS